MRNSDISVSIRVGDDVYVRVSRRGDQHQVANARELGKCLHAALKAVHRSSGELPEQVDFAIMSLLHEHDYALFGWIGNREVGEMADEACESLAELASEVDVMWSGWLLGDVASEQRK